MAIEDIKALEVLNSRGIPTVEVWVFSNGLRAYSSCPQGKSKGKYEAKEVRDNNPKRYFGMGVKKVVNAIQTLVKPLVVGKEACEYSEIEKALIQKKEILGSNGLLPTIVAIMKLCSLERGKSLYEVFEEYYKSLGGKGKRSFNLTPMANLINGGLHSGSYISFQEFMVVPLGIKEVEDKIRAVAEIFHELGKVIETSYGRENTNYGDEGGYVLIKAKENREAIEVLIKAIERSGYEGEVKVSLDVAASSFFKDGK